MPNRVAVVGVDHLGRAAARLARRDPTLAVVSLLDSDPAKLGTDPLDAGLIVTNDAAAALERADVAVLCVGGDLPRAGPLVELACEHKCHVVAACGRLAWPWLDHAEAAGAIDERARSAGVAVLGLATDVGFGPGLMSLVASFAVPEVTRVRASRRLDAGGRRPSVQARCGVTFAPDRFERHADAGRLGPRGLAESVALLLAGLGARVEPGEVVETVDPVAADRPVGSAHGEVRPGHAAGCRAVARWRGGGLEVEVDWTGVIGCSEPADVVEVAGPVPVRLKVSGGAPGEAGDAAMLAHAARLIGGATPGLRTLLDLPALPRGRRAMVIEA